MDTIAEGYDEEVMEWEDALTEKLKQIPLPSQEQVCIVP